MSEFNKDELKSITRKSVVMEMAEMTRKGDLVWSQISIGQYRAENATYDFFLTKTGPDGIGLDVMKDGQRYTSYHSAVLDVVSDLYFLVDRMGSDSENKGKMKAVSQMFSDIERGCS